MVNINIALKMRWCFQGLVSFRQDPDRKLARSSTIQRKNGHEEQNQTCVLPFKHH